MPDLTLEAVLDHYEVYLPRRRGKIRCFVPDHDDHVASCSVNLDTDQWNCFACGNGGGPLQALMLLEGLTDRADAIEFATNAGLGDGNPTVRGKRRSFGRVPMGQKGFVPKFRRHIPAWKGT